MSGEISAEARVLMTEMDSWTPERRARFLAFSLARKPEFLSALVSLPTPEAFLHKLMEDFTATEAAVRRQVELQ